MEQIQEIKLNGETERRLQLLVDWYAETMKWVYDNVGIPPDKIGEPQQRPTEPIAAWRIKQLH